jgi:hypothetical protein
MSRFYTGFIPSGVPPRALELVKGIAIAPTQAVVRPIAQPSLNFTQTGA